MHLAGNAIDIGALLNTAALHEMLNALIARNDSLRDARSAEYRAGRALLREGQKV